MWTHANVVENDEYTSRAFQWSKAEVKSISIGQHLNSFLKFIEIHLDAICLGPCWHVWLTSRRGDSLIFPPRWLPTSNRQKRELKSSNEIYYNTSAFCLRSLRAFWFEQVIAKKYYHRKWKFLSWLKYNLHRCLRILNIDRDSPARKIFNFCLFKNEKYKLLSGFSSVIVLLHNIYLI